MKIKINGKTYESVRLMCGAMEDYFDIVDQIEERAEQNKNITKEHRLLIKEFICTAFGNEFTTEDIDKNLDYADLMIYFRMIGEEVSEKAHKKFEKLAKK